MEQSTGQSETSTQDYTVVESPKRKWALVAGLAIVLAAVIGMAWWWWQKGESSPAAALPAADSGTAAVLNQGMFPRDKDGDGLTDGQELEMGTSDLEFDTDGDGLSDVIELEIWKTNPTEVDSDGDGFADGYEVLNGFNPKGTGKLE